MLFTEKNIRNIFIYILPKFIGYGLSLITFPILMRLLTPKDFGVIALVSLFPALPVGIFSCGMVDSAQRYYFEYRHDRSKVSAFIFSSQLFLYSSFVLSSVLIFFLKEHISNIIIGNNTYAWAVFIAYITAYLSYIITFYLTLYQNMEIAWLYSAFVMLQAFVGSVGGLFLVWYFKISYMGLIYGSFLSALIVCLIIVIIFNKDTKVSFNKSMLLENLAYGLQVVPKSFSSFINRFFDKYMLNNILSLSAVGIYNIGQAVGNTVFVLMSAVWSSFQPVYYKEVFDKGREGSKSVGRFFSVFSYVVLTPVFFLILFVEEMVYLLAPRSYYGAIDIIIIILGAFTVNVFGMYIGVQFAYSKKAYFVFPITVVGTIANVGANIILIPLLGLRGAAVATVVAYFVSNFLLAFVGQRLYRIAYEWKQVLVLNGLVFAAIISMLYCRDSVLNKFFIYAVKIFFVIGFIAVGRWMRVLTKEKIKKVYAAFYRPALGNPGFTDNN